MQRPLRPSMHARCGRGSPNAYVTTMHGLFSLLHAEPMAVQSVCDYAVLNASAPVTLSAAQALAANLGYKIASAGSEAEYNSILGALGNTYAKQLLALTKLQGVWIDLTSGFRPSGFTPSTSSSPAVFSALTGEALTATNLANTTLAAVIVKRCPVQDTFIGNN